MCEYQPISGLTGFAQLSHTTIKIPDVIQYLYSETLSFVKGTVFPIFGRKITLIQH